MQNLVIKLDRKGKDYQTYNIFNKIEKSKNAIYVQELYIYRDHETKETKVRLSNVKHHAFLCLNCRKVEYHNNGNGHIYPLCSECANTEKIFHTYFYYPNNKDAKLKDEYLDQV